MKVKGKKKSDTTQSSHHSNSTTADESVVLEKIPSYSLANLKRDSDEKTQLFMHIPASDEPVGATRYEWDLIYDETGIKLFRRTPEQADNSNFDTYQIRTRLEKVTAEEICRYFWDVDYRLEWEVSVDVLPTILNKPADNTVLLHQCFRPIFLTTQRYSVFWSQYRPIDVSDVKDNESSPILSKCCVINQSVNYPLQDESLRKESSKMIFLTLDVILMCETKQKGMGNKPKSQLTRDDIVTDVVYVCRVDPGGWTPVAAARIAAKKEYPRFIKRLSRCVLERCAHTPLTL